MGNGVQMDVVSAGGDVTDLLPVVLVIGEAGCVKVNLLVFLTLRILVLLPCYEPELENGIGIRSSIWISLCVAKTQMRPQLFPRHLVWLDCSGLVDPAHSVVDTVATGIAR